MKTLACDLKIRLNAGEGLQGRIHAERCDALITLPTTNQVPRGALRIYPALGFILIL
jgi:hypothetical protein